MQCPRCGSFNVCVSEISHMDWFEGICNACGLVGDHTEDKQKVVLGMREKMERENLLQVSKQMRAGMFNKVSC